MTCYSTSVQLSAFVAVTLQRACHNSLIEWAKDGQEHAAHTTSSVIFASQAACVLIGWGLSIATGGPEAFMKCFNPVTLKKFGFVGALYSAGSVFEMESVNYIDSATYTVISQSKLLVTAVLMMYYDGTYQTPKQWLLLILIVSGVAEFVLVGKAGGGLVFNTVGLCLNLTKVFISCNVGVLNAKALKTDKNSFPVQFSCLKTSWALAAFVYMIVKDGVMGDPEVGMMGTWTSKTVVLVFCGFVANTVCNQMLLKVLASALMKNLSEAIGVPLVYFAKVAFLGGVFQLAAANAAVIVIIGCALYILAKGEVEAAKKKEQSMLGKVEAGFAKEYDALTGKSN
jgi:hypothetical protein